MNISCIIPTKNRADFILNAINSVINQKYQVSEIIVVDDGSKDNTLRSLKNNFSHLNNLKIISSRDLGAGRARNLGVSVCTGDILMFLDSDDEWLDNHTEILLRGHLMGYHVCFARTKNVSISEGYVFYIPDYEFVMNEGEFFNKLVRWCHLVPSSFSIDKNAFLSSGGFSGDRIGEDWLFFLKLAEKYDFFYNHDIITKRNFHENCLCKTAFNHYIALELNKKIQEIAINSKRTNKEDLEWLKKTMKIIEKMGKNWKTVQDWYQCLKRENLL